MIQLIVQHTVQNYSNITWYYDKNDKISNILIIILSSIWKNQKWINIRLIGLNEPNTNANMPIIQIIYKYMYKQYCNNINIMFI